SPSLPLLLFPLSACSCALCFSLLPPHLVHDECERRNLQGLLRHAYVAEGASDGHRAQPRVPVLSMTVGRAQDLKGGKEKDGARRGKGTTNEEARERSSSNRATCKP